MNILRLSVYVVLFFLTAQSLSAQRIGCGLNASLGTETHSNNIGIGVGLNAQFMPDSSNYIFRVSFRPFYSQLNSNHFKHSLYATSYEATLIYSAKEGIGRPYLGAGIGYVTLTLEQNGNALVVENRVVSLSGYDNAFIFNFFAGAGFNRYKVFVPYIELNYRIMPISYKIKSSELNQIPVVTDEYHSYSEFVLNFGFMLNF